MIIMKMMMSVYFIEYLPEYAMDIHVLSYI